MPSQKKLPEISVSHGAIVQHAREMAGIRGQIAVLESQEKAACQKIKDSAESVRKARLEGKEDPRFVGLIRIVADDVAPVRCEFKLAKNTALKLSEEKKLNDLYGAARPLLFGREKVITEITDPGALIEELKAQGKNPWDYLNLTVKPELVRAVADSKHVIAQEAFLPKKGFLETLNDIEGTMKPEALDYTKEYLNNVLTSSVNMTKASGEEKK